MNEDKITEVKVEDAMFKGIAERAIVAAQTKKIESGKPQIKIVAKDPVTRLPDPEPIIKHRPTEYKEV